MNDYRGYVNLTEAAGLIGVSIATLSRRRDLGVALGGREVGLSPTEVLNLADFFKRRPLSEVAGGLVERAHRLSPAVADAVTVEVDAVLSARPPQSAPMEGAFLAEARRVLPRRLYAQVARYYRESERKPASLGPVAAPVERAPRRMRPATAPRRAANAEVSAPTSAESGALAQTA